MSFPHPAKVIRQFRETLIEEVHHYHVFAQMQRFVSAWLVAFLLLGARGPVDGWNALFSTLLASAATAARQVWPVVSTPLIDNLLKQAAAEWTRTFMPRSTRPPSMAAHPAGNPKPAATQPTTMNSMNTPSPTPQPAPRDVAVFGMPPGTYQTATAVTSPALSIPINGTSPLPPDTGS